MSASLAALAGGLLLLYLGGEGLVRGSASLGLRMGMPPLMTGLTIVAIGTSAPELMVSLQSALRGEDGLAIGSVVGSNICNIGLILGLSILIRPIAVDSRLIRRDVPIMIFCALVLAAMLLDSVLSRSDGAVLITGLLAFLVYVVKASGRTSEPVRSEFSHALKEVPLPAGANLLIAVLGTVALVYGGILFVRGAIGISAFLGIDPAVIGLSIAAIGTSLPELATSIVAATRGYGDMAAGNIVGSNIFNTLAILGVTASVNPLTLIGVTRLDLGVMIIASLLTLRLMSTRARMERWEGGVLLLGFIAYLASLFT